MLQVQALLLVALYGCAQGCSYVELAVPDSGSPNGTKYVIARTNEYGNVLDSVSYEIHLNPRKSSSLGYISLVAVALDLVSTIVSDGMNELGLTVSAQTLRDSVYEEKSEDRHRNVLSSDVVPNLLEACGDVDAALAWLENHTVTEGLLEGKLHWSIADASGRSVVVEYLEGRRVVYENTPRVMTNEPPLDFHWRNLNTYVNLNPSWPSDNDNLAVDTSLGSFPRVWGHGWNLHGLPGDTSPPSRFVQLFYLRGYAMQHKPPKSVNDAMVIATGLLNRVFIPFGTVARNGIKEPYEYTSYGVIKIPSERRMLVRGYSNQQWRELDFSKLDFTQKRSWPIEDGTLGVRDISAEGSPKFDIV